MTARITTSTTTPEPPRRPDSPRLRNSPRLTDSPWFWVYLFSTAAFAALMLMTAKYQHRQTHLEDEYRYGTRTLHRPPAGASANSAVASPAAAANELPDRAPLAEGPQPPTHEMLISLMPLRVLSGLAMVVSCVALQWSYLRRRAKARAAQ